MLCIIVKETVRGKENTCWCRHNCRNILIRDHLNHQMQNTWKGGPPSYFHTNHRFVICEQQNAFHWWVLVSLLSQRNEWWRNYSILRRNDTQSDAGSKRTPYRDEQKSFITSYLRYSALQLTSDTQGKMISSCDKQHFRDIIQPLWIQLHLSPKRVKTSYLRTAVWLRFTYM